jgi:hypothetical protein
MVTQYAMIGKQFKLDMMAVTSAASGATLTVSLSSRGDSPSCCDSASSTSIAIHPYAGGELEFKPYSAILSQPASCAAGFTCEPTVELLNSSTTAWIDELVLSPTGTSHHSGAEPLHAPCLSCQLPMKTDDGLPLSCRLYPMRDDPFANPASERNWVKPPRGLMDKTIGAVQLSAIEPALLYASGLGSGWKPTFAMFDQDPTTLNETLRGMKQYLFSPANQSAHLPAVHFLRLK